MDAAELLRICNIASSIGKEKSLTGNFGIGAKLSPCLQPAWHALPFVASMAGFMKSCCANETEYTVVSAAIIQTPANI